MNRKFVIQFLMQDYINQAQNLRHESDSLITRTNLFVTIVTASLGGLLILYLNTKFADMELNLVVSAGLGVVLILGFLIYAELTQLIMKVVDTNHQLILIKDHFIASDKSLISNIGLGKAQSQFLVKRRTWKALCAVDLGAKQIVTFLNNSVAAMIVFILVLTLISPDPYLITISSAIAFVFFWVIQFFYSRLRYWLADQETSQAKLSIVAQRHHIRMPKRVKRVHINQS